MSATATLDSHRLARAFLALGDDLDFEAVRPTSLARMAAALAAAVVLAIAVPLTWMGPAAQVTSGKVGDQPAATLGSSKAVMAPADDEDDGE